MRQKQKSLANSLPVSAKMVERRIYIIRGQEVMLDSDLAELYKIPTFRLNESVKRNKARFPEDFIFQLTKEESQNLISQIAISSNRSQIATGSPSYGGRRFFPYAFTEHGVAMLSSVLHSPFAVQMNILIIRAFIQLRQMLAQQANLTKRLNKIEGVQNFHDQVLTGLVEDIKKIKNPPRANAIGFNWRKQK